MKKTMSLVLTITVMLSVMAITPVMAETTGVPTDQGYTIIPATTEGIKNDEYGWKVDGTTLYLYYTGAPGNYASTNYTTRPWNDSVDTITKVVIDGTPTEIGIYTFYGMSKLADVKFAGTETNINNCAFAKTGLTGVFKIPEHVIYVHAEALKNTRINVLVCEGGASSSTLYFRKGLQYLGDLSAIVLERRVSFSLMEGITGEQALGTYAGGDYGMTNPARIHMLVADASYITPFANLVEYTAAVDTTTTNAKNREYSIAPGRFGEYTLFDRSKGVTYGKFADHVQYMLYYENNGSDLTAEFITDGDEDGTNLVTNGYTVANNKYTIKDTVLDTNVANIKKMVFGTGFTTIPANFGTNSGINDELYGAGKSTRYENLKEVKFPATLTTINTCAFNRVKTLSKVNLEDTKVSTIPTRAFNGCTFKEVTFPETIRTVGQKTFSDNPDLEYVYFPKATNLTISQNAFTKDILPAGFAGKNLKVIFDEVKFTTVNAEAFCTNKDIASDQWRKTTVIYNDSKTDLPETAPNGITPVADKYYEVSDADNNNKINLFMCNFDANQDYKLFMGTYADNALSNTYMLKEGTLTKGNFINTEVDASANIVSGNTKVFLWDGFGNIKPLTTGVLTK